jgi:thioredoxin-like negative regulator of GroEL
MSFFDLFSGPSTEKLEGRADALFEAGLWGRSRLAYERVLAKMEKVAAAGADRRRVSEKLAAASRALAAEHLDNARQLIEGGYAEDARSLLDLAAALNADDAFQRDLEETRDSIDNHGHQSPPAEWEETVFDAGETPAAPPAGPVPEEDFLALSQTLPAAVRQIYLGYGSDFIEGYKALNRGAFETAARLLEMAMERHPEPDSYVPLELATAYLNLDRTQEARRLLQGFVAHHRDALPAYQILCEIFWDQGDFAAAEDLLAALPAELAGSVAAVRLRGETLFRSGRYRECGDLYEGFLASYGHNDTLARELARAYQALGKPAKALALYGEIMANCAGCGARVDPRVKHEFAELNYSQGHHTLNVLELYLALAQENPGRSAHYFERVSRIYATLGNESEARRFQAFSARAAAAADGEAGTEP